MKNEGKESDLKKPPKTMEDVEDVEDLEDVEDVEDVEAEMETATAASRAVNKQSWEKFL